METFTAATNRALTAYADLGPTQRSTSDALPSPKSQPKSVPARIKLLIADLGLRYRPTAAVDLEAHGSMLALLAIDLADIPPDRLDRAIATWVRAEKWMPRASDLIELCQRQQRAEADGRAQSNDGRTNAERAWAHCNSRNAGLKRDDIEWFVDATGEPKLRYKVQAAAGIQPIRPAHVEQHNEALARFDAAFRYEATGDYRDLTADEEAARIRRGGPTFD